VIVLVLVALYWGAVHADSADLCKPRVGEAVSLLCESGAARAGYGSTGPGLVLRDSGAAAAAALQSRAEAGERRLRALLWEQQ